MTRPPEEWDFQEVTINGEVRRINVTDCKEVLHAVRDILQVEEGGDIIKRAVEVMQK